MTSESLSLALIGTSRGGDASAFPLPPAAHEAAAQLPPAPAERTLLNRASLLFACEACGVKPASAEGEWVPPCKADERTACSQRAADILHDLLTSNARELIAEWLQLAKHAQRRPPHRLLPALLDLAA